MTSVVGSDVVVQLTAKDTITLVGYPLLPNTLLNDIVIV